MIAFGIILIVLGVLLAVGFIMDDWDNDGFVFRAFSMPTVSGLIITLGAYMIYYEHDPKPTALDVYRNKTELQINYKTVKGDTIPTDSIVIWK